MSAPCPICGEKLIRTSSISDKYICPIDGTRVKLSVEDTTNLDVVNAATAFGFGQRDTDKLTHMVNDGHIDPNLFKTRGRGIGQILDSDALRETVRKAMDAHTCDDCPPPITVFAQTPENELRALNSDLPGNENFKSASIRKEAIWYMLKPRWIIRRKIQTAIRKKVRSQLHPLTFIKSTSTTTERCERCAGILPDGHRTSCLLNI